MINTNFKQKAFSLTEVIIAVAILGIVLVTVCGVFVHGLHSIKKSKYRSGAINIANQKFDEIKEADWSCPSGLPVDKLSQPSPDGVIDGFVSCLSNGNDPYILWDTQVAAFVIYGFQVMGGIEYDYTISIEPTKPYDPYVKRVSVLVEWDEVEGKKDLELVMLIARRY